MQSPASATDRALVRGTQVAGAVLTASGLVLAYSMLEMEISPIADWTGPLAVVLMSLLWLLSVVAPTFVGVSACVAPRRPMLQQGVALTSTLPLFLALVVFSGVVSAALEDPVGAELQPDDARLFLLGTGGLVMAAAIALFTRLDSCASVRVPRTGWVLWAVMVATLTVGIAIQAVVVFGAASEGNVEVPALWGVAVLVAAPILAACLMSVAFHPDASARAAASYWCGGVMAVFSLMWLWLFLQDAAPFVAVVAPVLAVLTALPLLAGAMTAPRSERVRAARV